MSVKSYLDRYVVVDLETTGLEPGKDRILEIGAVKVEQGVVTDTFGKFADPQMLIPMYVQKLTGISQDMVAGKQPPSEIVAEFMEFSEGYDLMGHNLMFDYRFLKHQAVNQKLSFEKRGIDTLKISRCLLPDLESRSLSYLCEYFQLHREFAHRAYHDAMATHELYRKLLEQSEEGQEKLFQPVDLQYKVKRQGPITNAQKTYLNDLIKYHRIELDVEIESLTKNEASRRIDKILSEYGRIMR